MEVYTTKNSAAPVLVQSGCDEKWMDDGVLGGGQIQDPAGNGK